MKWKQRLITFEANIGESLENWTNKKNRELGVKIYIFPHYGALMHLIFLVDGDTIEQSVSNMDPVTKQDMSEQTEVYSDYELRMQAHNIIQKIFSYFMKIIGIT